MHGWYRASSEPTRPSKCRNAPFRAALGAQSITGTGDVFPAHLHFEDAGDAGSGRPPVVIDVDCAATNPLFLQGLAGYEGTAGKPQTVGYYYYSWPQQQTSGTVTIDGTSYVVAGGLTWMDHQWGGNVPVTSGPISTWSGWSWFEFQFEGNRSLTLTNTHGPIPGGTVTPNPGFGTYIDESAGVTELVGATLTVTGYTPSPSTTAQYPSGWQLLVGGPLVAGVGPQGVIQLSVTPVAAVKPQALWMGGQVEYAEAAVSVTAVGTIAGTPVSLSGVGYCESVGFEDPALANARALAILPS